MQRRWMIVAAALVVLAPVSAASQAQSADRQIPVFVRGRVEPAVVMDGAAIELAVTITNGLPRAIYHSGSWTEPVGWNGETISLSVVDVYRDGQPGNLLISRPDVTLPRDVSGIGRARIESGRSLSIRTDARKWTLRDGWLHGSYAITVRIDNLAVDDHCSLSVVSDPIGFTITTTRDAATAPRDHPEPSIDRTVRGAAGRELDDLIAAATTRPWPGEGYPVLPALSTEMRGRIGSEITGSGRVRAAYEKLDAAMRNNTEWFEGVEELEAEGAVWCLASCLVHPHEDVQINALRALERLGDRRVVPFLLTYAEYMAVLEGGSESATMHGIIHSSIAKTLSTLTGIAVEIDGQDPEALRAAIAEWRRWLADQPDVGGP